VQGSHHTSIRSWDMCALHIIAPIEPIYELFSENFECSIIITGCTTASWVGDVSSSSSEAVVVDGPPSYAIVSPILSTIEIVTTNSSSSTIIDTGSPRLSLVHPDLPNDTPLIAVTISSMSVSAGQEVRLLSYPGIRIDRVPMLSIDWGRVQHNGDDVLISLLSDHGSSGGPILDRAGCLLGLLTRSHKAVKMSCMQKLHNIQSILLSLSQSTCEQQQQETYAESLMI
jgi:hypothetical protein